MHSIKDALSEALSRRKKDSYASSEEQDKKKDLAPSVNDKPSAKIEIEIGMKHPEMDMKHPEGDAFAIGLEDPKEMEQGESSDPDLATLLGREPTAQDLERLKSPHGKPRSLMEAAQRAMANKKG